MFTDEKETEHLLYAAIGTATNQEQPILTGFYERSSIIQDSDGELKSVSEQLKLVQQKENDRQ